MPRTPSPPNKPRVSSVVNVVAGQRQPPASKARQTSPILRTSPESLVDEKGQMDPKAVARELGLIHDALRSATENARSNPYGSVSVSRQVVMSAGTIGSITATGTTPPTVYLSGYPLGNFSLKILITTGGALGTAIFKYSIDNGSTFSPTMTTAPTVLLDSSYANTGVTVTFSSGTYTAGGTPDTYTATTSVNPVQVKHGLTEPAGYWRDMRTYSGSQPFKAVEAKYGGPLWSTTIDINQYVVLIPVCTGTYDIAVYPN